MYYYEVLVADYRYRSNKLLTYSSGEKIALYTAVIVPLKNRPSTGLIMRKVSAPKNIRLKSIEAVITDKPLPGWIANVVDWLAQYYPSTKSQATQLYLPQQTSSLKKLPLAPPEATEHISPIPKTLKPALTTEQKEAVKSIKTTDSSSVLLHGTTGSGKTRVYTELIAESLGKGLSALVLTPEIGLTPQLEQTLKNYFGNRVVVSHSRLTSKQRRDIWLKTLYTDEPLVVIGPRSALFYPLQSIGLIVVDEAHDSSYKQEQMPHYQATRVAATMAKHHNCKVILGTATPSIVDYFTFQQKQLPIIRMRSSALTGKPPSQSDIHIITTSQRNNFTKSAWLCDQLMASTKQAIESGQQAIIYLNRRGTSRLIVCADCGWHAVCPDCDSLLVYHDDEHRLRCHSCTYHQPAPLSCADCDSSDISYRSAGTKFIAQELSRLFPQAKIARFDSDSQKVDSLQSQYQALKEGKFDIAVGTKILSKGLDLPKLSTIGILQADNALLLPDFVAEEELFQEIYQLLGRIGRGHNTHPAEAFIQTSQPNHPVIIAAKDQNYDLFYEKELTKRQKYDYPPFVHLLVVTVARATQKSAKQTLTKIVNAIKNKNLNVSIEGPAPALKELSGKQYHWKLVIKSRKRQDLVTIAKDLPATVRYDIDPIRVL